VWERNFNNIHSSYYCIIEMMSAMENRTNLKEIESNGRMGVAA
jgi:hypothetical protein